MSCGLRAIVLALDDFVVGQSSIGYLRQFKLDRVKLARSLVSGVDTDATKFSLVETTVRVARDAGLSITALGVERKEEATRLLRLGCTEFQGFLFARPMGLEALTKLILGATPAEPEAEARPSSSRPARAVRAETPQLDRRRARGELRLLAPIVEPRFEALSANSSTLPQLSQMAKAMGPVRWQRASLQATKALSDSSRCARPRSVSFSSAR